MSRRSCRTFLSFAHCDVICDLLQYTHTENVIYLLNNKDNVWHFFVVAFLGILKNSKEKLERNISTLQEDNRKLTDKCHQWKEESRMFRDRNKTQEILIEKSNK